MIVGIGVFGIGLCAASLLGSLYFLIYELTEASRHERRAGKIYAEMQALPSLTYGSHLVFDEPPPVVFVLASSYLHYQHGYTHLAHEYLLASSPSWDTIFTRNCMVLPVEVE